MSATIVLDTNIVSYFFKGDTRAALYRPYLADAVVNLSFMTVAEMFFGAERGGWGVVRRRRLEVFLRAFPVIHSDAVLCSIWADISAVCEHQGRTIAIADAWIAACTLRHNASLVTHNRRHFEAVPSLTIISEAPQER